MHRISLHFSVVVFVGLLAGDARGADAPHDYEQVVRGIVERRCVGCQGADTQEAGVSFADLKEGHVALQKRPLWKRSLRRITTDEMPPEDAEQLTTDEKRQLTEWDRFAIEHVDALYAPNA